MIRTITFLLATFISVTSLGQSFEGKIVYKNTYKSKLSNVTDEQFTTMMGSIQGVFHKKRGLQICCQWFGFSMATLCTQGKQTVQ